MKAKTILITGASSGYGHATAIHFANQGWNVIATMRTPKPDLFQEMPNVKILPLDVTSPASITNAIQAAGQIDVLVNNAGIGVVGAFEATPISTTREVFETNTFGVIAMCQAIIPQFRERKSGLIVNVTSSVTLARMPLAAVYTASKAAIEGFTGSLAFELEAFNVAVKLVEPGYGPSTQFAANGAERLQGLIPEPYALFAQEIFTAFAHQKVLTKESDVAETIWRAVHDQTNQLRHPAGPDAIALAQTR